VTASSSTQSGQPSNADSDTATLTITSDPTGADIEIDGSFSGSTPSTIKVAKGAHKVTVKKEDMLWQRDIDIKSGSSISVNAALQK
jgi:hypothetical protein